MNNKEIKHVIEKAKEFNSTLDINLVRQEFIRGYELKNKRVAKKDLINVNSKLKKQDNNIHNVFTYGLELAPFTLSGVNFCPFAGECFTKCIVWSGVQNFLKKEKMFKKDGELTPVLKLRLKRSFLYNNDKEFFFKILELDILKIHLLHKALGEEAWFRLNVFSDIDFSQIIRKLSKEGVMFYDYTKDLSREEFDNYKLTYSKSEKMSDEKMKELLSKSKNVAVVFDGELPDVYKGFPVINGDVSDARQYDPKGVIVGLKEKKTIGEYKESKFVEKGGIKLKKKKRKIEEHPFPKTNIYYEQTSRV